ncbi:glycosyltransferase family 39 protein [Streptomyces hypolithicus]
MKSPTAPLRDRVLVWLLPMSWTLALGLWGLPRQDSVWRDEAATWQVAQRSTAEIWNMLGNVDVVHGCYYLLMHGLFEYFGPSTTTLRLPSVLATGVAAACVAVIGHRLAGLWVGLAGGLAFGVLPAVQFYLQEGRPYALVAAGAGFSTLLLVTALQGRAQMPHWVAYGGTVLVCGLLNWLSLMILPAHLITLLWTRATLRVSLRWGTASAAATACVLPLVLFSHGQSVQVSWIPPLTWHMLIGPAILLLIGGVGAALDRPRAGQLSVAAVGLPLLAVPQLGLVGLSLIQPLFLDRYILFSLLGLALLIGSIIGSAVQAANPGFPRASRWILPAVVALAMMALLPQSLAKRSPASRVDDVLAAASEVRRMKEPGSAVLFIPSARRDTKSVSPSAFTGLRDIALAQSPEKSGTLKGVEADPDQIRAALLAQQRILLVTDASQVARPVTAKRDRLKTSVLTTYFTVVADEQVRGRRVTAYERRAAAH